MKKELESHLKRELLKGNTPLLVLAILRDQPLHGYAISKEINRRTNNSLECAQGTLYPVLNALEKGGYVQAFWDFEGAGPRKRVYVLTNQGREHLVERIDAWEQFCVGVSQILASQTP